MHSMEQHVTNAHHMQPPPSHRRERAKSRERERFATVDPPYIDDIGARDRNHNLPNGGFERVDRGRSSHRGPPVRESSLDKDYRYGLDHYGHEDSSRLGVHDNRERRGSREFRLDPNRRPSFSSSVDIRQGNSNDYWPQDNIKDSSRSYTSSSGHLDAPMYRERRKSHEFDRSPLRRDGPERASAPDRGQRDRQWKGQEAQDLENANLSRGSRQRHASQPNNVLPVSPHQSRQRHSNVQSPSLQDFVDSPPVVSSSRLPYTSTPANRGREDNRGQKSPYIDDPTTQRQRSQDSEVFLDEDFANANTTQENNPTNTTQRHRRHQEGRDNTSKRHDDKDSRDGNYRRLPKPRGDQEAEQRYTKSGKEKRKYRDDRDIPYSQQEGAPHQRKHGANRGRVQPPDEVKTHI